MKEQALVCPWDRGDGQGMFFLSPSPLIFTVGKGDIMKMEK